MDRALAKKCAMRLFTGQLWTLLDKGCTLRKIEHNYRNRIEVEYYLSGGGANLLTLDLDKGTIGHRDGGYGRVYWERPPSWQVRCGNTILASFYFYVDSEKGADLKVDA